MLKLVNGIANTGCVENTEILTPKVPAFKALR